MRLFFINLLVFITAITNLQDIHAQGVPDSDPIDSVYVVDKKIQVHSLLKYTSVFVDSSNEMTVQEVAAEKLRGKFQPFDSLDQPPAPYISYWLKFSISSPDSIQDWWLIHSGVPEFDTVFGEHAYVDVYFLDTVYQVKSHQRTGLFVPRSEKRVKQNSGVNRVLISVNPNETIHVYTRINNEYSPEYILPPQLRNPIVGIPAQRGEIFMSVLAGAVFLFSIISFFFFFFVRDRAYLFFGIYALVLALSYLVLHPDHPFVDIFIPEHPQLILPAFVLFTQGSFIFFVLFGRDFINLPQLSKKLDTILKWFISVWILNIFITIILLIVTHKPFHPETGFVFIGLFLVFLIRIAFFKSILVRFYVAGALWLVCFTILGLIWERIFIELPFNPWPVGQIGQLLIYIAGLAYKLRLNQQASVQAEVVRLRNVELASLYEESTKQKGEIEKQKKNLEETLVDLKATQSQLIQSEKMASLGELTAGIAHEIQNPLNFVNNFADVNSELIAEMKQELDNGKIEDAKNIANNIDENEQKIIFHGKRADAIVKGMLQHSRSSSGLKEPTDINALADEYLRLAYHGLRAKDKSFNATMKTDFDESIGLVNVNPQDMGRVILNLITNAFYAVSIPRPLEGRVDFKPTVTVITKKQFSLSGGGGFGVQIFVKDNGPGIPLNIIDKIFQPFFTTKVSGQGTGLGLSLSYDIVKAHGGELKVETTDGEGTVFIISLPVT
ncbi:MAG TPA: ATP-binding protein [Saprospiraceae bacterium]|nr:ATP-binding protein [Saprospiraceae bacterium]